MTQDFERFLDEVFAQEIESEMDRIITQPKPEPNFDVLTDPYAEQDDSKYW